MKDTLWPSGSTRTGVFGFSESHCSPVSMSTADSTMTSTSVRDCEELAVTTGAICSRVHLGGYGDCRVEWFLVPHQAQSGIALLLQSCGYVSSGPSYCCSWCCATYP